LLSLQATPCLYILLVCYLGIIIFFAFLLSKNHINSLSSSIFLLWVSLENLSLSFNTTIASRQSDFKIQNIYIYIYIKPKIKNNRAEVKRKRKRKRKREESIMAETSTGLTKKSATRTPKCSL
jgi:hypothetical protein